MTVENQLKFEWGVNAVAGPSDMPEGWVATTLDQILQGLESGSRPKGGVRGINEGMPSIGGEHLDENGGFRFGSIKFVPPNFFEKMNHGHIQVGDILIVKDGATTGKVAFVREDFPYNPAVVNEHVFICRPAEVVYPPFLFYFLFSKEGQASILNNFRGSAQGGINQSFARGTSIPLAPFSEQKRIVAKVEELLARVNMVRERLARVKEILKRFRQSVLAAACSGRLTEDWRAEHPYLESAQYFIDNVAKKRAGEYEAEYKKAKKERQKIPRKPSNLQPRRVDTDGLPELPDGWAWAYLPYLGYMNRGKSQNRPRNAPHLYGGLYPFIQTGDIAQSGGHITSHRQTYSEAGLAQSRLWPAGTVCITIAANIANSAILTYPACFPDSVVGVITDTDLCLAEYLEYFIQTARSDLNQFAPATSQKNINIAILSNLAVPLPPLSEQKQIVHRAEILFKLADTIDRRVSAAAAQTESLTQAILAKAFRGELVLTEAELARQEGHSYEPASALLAKIKTQRK
jgi:type I restriction enzyme S subunit